MFSCALLVDFMKKNSVFVLVLVPGRLSICTICLPRRPPSPALLFFGATRTSWILAGLCCLVSVNVPCPDYDYWFVFFSNKQKMFVIYNCN